ncbi:MAG: hypothetical protein IK062_10705 [Selenomonadaceae bacterium]|nr:hypothetical protein [Selenomonadaceae bacterium]
MTKNDLIEKAKAMISAPSCCPELTAAGQAWIDSIGKSDETEKAGNLISEIKEDVTTIDDLVAFAHSDTAKKIFGEGQKDFAAHADELKASGAEFCDCGACKPALEILENKSLILD